jgi:ketosteroid isomerase-like protein
MPSVSASDRAVVEGVFKAMQAGPAGEGQMMSLFADDAVFVEPFSGQSRTHRGAAEIRASLRQMNEQPLPDMRLTLDRVDLDGERVRAEWTCSSPVFPVPMKGYDLFTIRNGKIARLEINVTEGPPVE